MDKDDMFKEIAENDDTDFLNSNFDFDGKGRMLKGEDGYKLKEKLDIDTKEPVRIVGLTSPKTEILTDGHP